MPLSTNLMLYIVTINVTGGGNRCTQLLTF